MNAYLGNSIDSAVNSVTKVVATAGRAALHSMSPNNFEYYMCSLELINSSGVTKGFMTFAVMPNSISETEAQIANVVKTNRGITTVFNDSFIPKDISLQGTFGRKLRLLAGVKEAENVGSIPFFNGNLGFSPTKGGMMIKTGFGLIKLLDGMIKESFNLDENGYPCVLIFNNYALNTHYVVEVLQKSYTQSVENNMLWYYSLEMKAVAPAEAVNVRNGSRKNSSFFKNVMANSITRSLGRILVDIERMSDYTANINDYFV